MEPMRGVNSSHPSGAGKQPVQHESPEQLLDVFKAAALSVTKLYKTSATAQARARLDGYQDCLDDLLAFLDKERMGLDDGEGWKIRRWATEKLDGRDAGSQNTESEDETDRAETASSPELTRSNNTPQLSTQMRTDSAPPTVQPVVDEPIPIVVPSQDTFTFQSPHAYPNIATLDLSDSRPHDGPSITSTRSSKQSLRSGLGRPGPRSTTHFGQRAGSKRKLNIDEIFDLASLGGKDKDPFGSGGKRSRHA
ncbi:Fc.00g102260.m01.CDS01 [Cosmosporella sp. VM-42]